jgi:glycosyltransferase involved in cell wall biosynthesis
MDFDVKFIAKHWEHHSVHSGYDQLVDRLGSAIRPLNTESLRDKWVPGRIAVALAARSGNALYSYLAFYDEWAAMRDMLFRHDPCVYHVLYGDESYRYLGGFGKGRNARVVATYHLPPSALVQYLHAEYVRHLDGLIVVGRNQIPFFEPHIKSSKIFFVPHGVDTHTFTPPAEEPSARANQGICLFVGIHRRDFEMLREVIKLVHAQDKEIRFVIVTSESDQQMFREFENTQLLSRVPEPELVQLYQTADVLLQPLEDSTANNAILEGLACGLPVVATDIGAVRDYLSEDCGLLVPPYQAARMAEAVLCLVHDTSLRNRMALKARAHAVPFDWSSVTEMTRQVYERVMSKA